MPGEKSHVLVDTMVIIEAHRAKCWRALVGHYRLDTVGKCVEECETGNQRFHNKVDVDTVALIRELNPKSPLQADMNRMILKCPEAWKLGAGERHLGAYALTLDEPFRICSPDKEFVRVCFMLGILDSFISLEELAEAAGARVQLRDNFTKRFVEKVRTDIKLGLL